MTIEPTIAKILAQHDTFCQRRIVQLKTKLFLNEDEKAELKLLEEIVRDKNIKDAKDTKQP